MVESLQAIVVNSTLNSNFIFTLVLDSYQMEKYECVQSIDNVVFQNDPSSYFAVGTAFALPSEDEPHRGHILIFQVANTLPRQIRLVTETEVRGAVYSLVGMNGKLFAGINSKVGGSKLCCSVAKLIDLC
jgi:DNA damage-binding protein 1